MDLFGGSDDYIVFFMFGGDVGMGFCEFFEWVLVVDDYFEFIGFVDFDEFF